MEKLGIIFTYYMYYGLEEAAKEHYREKLEGCRIPVQLQSEELPATACISINWTRVEDTDSYSFLILPLQINLLCNTCSGATEEWKNQKNWLLAIRRTVQLNAFIHHVFISLEFPKENGWSRM